MTAAGWGLFIGGACSLCVSAWWARKDNPDRELLAIAWIALSIITVAVSMIFLNEPYDRVSRRAAFFAESAKNSLAIAPIAGSPLVVRISEAHATFGTQRLPVPGMHQAVLP